MKRVLLRKIFFSYLVISVLLIIILGTYLPSVIKTHYISHLREHLIVQSRLIAEKIPSPFKGNLDDFCRRSKERTGGRITIIDSSGRVLGDSDTPSAEMDNHSQRPEIMEAEKKGIGSAIRFSETTKMDSFYLATTLTRDSQKSFLRIAVPLQDIGAAVGKIRIQVIIASFASLLLVIVLGLLQTGRMIRAIEEITYFSKEVAAGDFTKRLFPRKKDEIGELAKNVSTMAEDLRKRLRQSEEEKYLIEAILRNMSDGLILTDTKGRIHLYNSAIKKFFGIESDMKGKTLIETFRKAELMEVIEKVVRHKERISRELEISYPGEFYLMVNAAPFYSSDVSVEISGVVLTFHDITRLKKLEGVRKDFVVNVSHEIKTPITAIKGFAETLLEGALDDRENSYKFLETIKNHSERLNSLVSDLLTLSRIELGDIKIEKTTVNLSDVVDTVFATLGEKARGKGLHLKKEVSPEPQHIQADRDRLIQILLNLVDNGIKFTEKGGVTVSVQSSKLKVKSEEKFFVTISVEDTGIGIPKRHLPRLGERFYRVDRARSRELGGTGLGLAIVKHLVKAHGWEMKIESTEGAGTKVRILCPVP